MDEYKRHLPWSICFSVMSFLIIVGNSLTIVTLLKKKFRKGPHFLLISLAVADLLVGCTIPLYIARAAMAPYNRKKLSYAWYQAALTFTSVSSMFHLLVISLERLHAILRPFRHRQLSLKAYWVAIATIWFLSFTMGILVSILIRFDLIMQRKMLIIIIVCILTPLLITCLCYLVIWRKRRKSAVRSFRQNQEARFSGTIFLVTVTSFIMWMPFLYSNIALRVSPIHTPMAAIFVFKLLQYSNSFVNFVIYILRLPSYRKALFSLCRF